MRAYGLVYARTQAALDRLAGEMDRARAKGDTIPSGWLFERARLARVLAETEIALAGFARDAAARVRAEQVLSITTGIDDARSLISSSLDGSGGSLGTRLGGLDTQAAEAAASFVAKGSPVRELLDAHGAQVSARVRDEIIAGVAQGAPVRVIASRIKEVFGGGLGRALTVSRTETLRAYREATRETFAAHRDVLAGWTWQCSLSGRACSICLALHGRLFASAARMHTHPNCRCVMVPLVRGARRPRTGAQWLASQEPGVQRDILGKGKFEAYSAGRLRLEELVGERRDARFGVVRFERTLGDVTGTIQNRGVRKIETVGATGEADTYIARRVGTLIAADPVASRLYNRMQRAGVRVELRFDAPDDPFLFGEFDPPRKVVRVFMRNNLSAREAVSTIVHEGRHVTRIERNRQAVSFAEEVRARLLEFVYRERRRPTIVERKALREIVRRAYPDLTED